MADGVVTGRRRAGVSRLAGALLVSLAGACDLAGPRASFSPISPSPTSSSAPTSAPSRLSGRVTNEAGSPIAEATVSGDFRDSDFNWLKTRTNGDGYYELPGGRGTYVSVHAEGYETNIQMLPRISTDIVQNLRLRRVRTINAGESIAVSVESDSSICDDNEFDSKWVLSRKCEVVRIVADRAGTLLIEARALNAGGPEAFLCCGVRSGPGAVSMTVQGAGVFSVLVGAPAEMPAERFEVLTSLR